MPTSETLTRGRWPSSKPGLPKKSWQSCGTPAVVYGGYRIFRVPRYFETLPLLTRRRRPTCRRRGPGRALRGVTDIQRGRLTPAHRHFGSATPGPAPTTLRRTTKTREEPTRHAPPDRRLTTEGSRCDALDHQCGSRRLHSADSRRVRTRRRRTHRGGQRAVVDRDLECRGWWLSLKRQPAKTAGGSGRVASSIESCSVRWRRIWLRWSPSI